MSNKYDIHTDFRRFPVLTVKFGAVFTWLFNFLTRVQRFFRKRPVDLLVEKHRISSNDGSRCKVITIKPRTPQASTPALVYYHGGGFAFTYNNLHLHNCERYARDTGCSVVFVDYRLAPKHPFPSGFDDCYAALQWTVQQADELGIDARRIAVGGDSAGGTLAAGVAQKARDEQLVELCAQLLIYPALDNSCSTPSATDFVDTPLWNAISNRHMWNMYLRRYPTGEIPDYAAPVNGQLHHLPLSYVETAEFDPLRDEGLNYASALQEEGTGTTVNATRRTVHGYDGIRKNYIAQQSMQARTEFLTRAFSHSADT